MSRSSLLSLYRQIRSVTEKIVEPLETEDFVVQTMQDVSPTKWHLAHTSWFFETFVLRPMLQGYRPVDERYAVLFNSYYRAAGERHPQPQRGLLSRPTVGEVFAYRRHVDEAMGSLLEQCSVEVLGRLGSVVELGLNHEEQHQELILTDIKHVLGMNPLAPRYGSGTDGAVEPSSQRARPVTFVRFEGGMAEIGAGGSEFTFDNETPRHAVYVGAFEIADRLVSSGEYAEFIADGGYERPELWLSDGWDAKEKYGWRGPLYWSRVDGEWRIFTLQGVRGLNPSEPVCHVSYYEADAHARWAKARLPLEEEWEVAAMRHADRATGNFLESGALHPLPGGGGARISQLLGDVWEWTGSNYLPYRGYVPLSGALGEYNGKFMSNRMVLRGGSCVTSRRHIRSTYRNFFGPEARWQFSGIRLARTAA